MKSSLSKVLFLSILALSAAALFWVFRPKPGIESTLITSAACKPPCWQDLMPGRSTQSDVDLFLEKLDKKHWPARRILEYSSTCTLRTVADQPGPIVNRFFRLTTENGILTFVEINPTLPITMFDIFELFGSPEFIQSVLAIGPDGQFYIVEVYYPQKGIALILQADQQNIGNLEPETRVSTIHFYPTGDMLSYLTYRYSCDVGQEGARQNAQRQITNFIRPWTGFGEVEVIITK